MKENTFSGLINGKLFQEDIKQTPRVTKRVAVKIPIIIEAKGRIFNAHLVDVSPTVIRIDQNISISFQESCTVLIKSAKPIQLICTPIIEVREFNEGSWNRLKIKSSANFELVDTLKKAG